MNHLINIIIIFIIIVSVFKRLQGIAKKGGEIKVPPASPPVPFPEMTEKYETPEESAQEKMEEPVRKPALSGEEILKEIFRVHTEPKATFEHEIIPVPPLPEQVEEPVSMVEQPLPARKAAPREKEKSYTLHFGGSELVRGILMSEILGTPVSLRGDMGKSFPTPPIHRNSEFRIQ